jgi:hypothetical protein
MNSKQTQEHPQASSFDEAGVANYIKDKAVLNWFRRIVQHYKVPLDKQAKLAVVLLDEAVEHNKGHLTLPFLKNHNYEDYIPSFVEHDTTTIDAKISEKIKLAAVENQFQRELKNFTRGLAIMSRSGHVMAGLLKQYPQVSFKVDNQSRRAIEFAKEVIDDLAEKLPPVSRWGK